MPEPDYLTVRTHTVVDRTVEVAPGINVDVDRDGLVQGVENVYGTVGVGVMRTALAAARFPKAGAGDA